MINFQLQNILNKTSVSLEDSKWKIYKTINDKHEKNKEIFGSNNSNNNIENSNNNIENIKTSYNKKINQTSTKYQILLSKYKYLKKENIHLKEIIMSKDKLISDFGILFQKFKDKFIKFEEINQALKRKLQNQDILLKYKDGSMKGDLNIIEKDYNMKLKEKDMIIEKMREELLYMHNEYKNLTEKIEKVNNYIQENEDNENNTENNLNMLMTFKNQENEYIKTINMLQNRIVDKDKEIQLIKEEFKKILND